MAHRATPTVPTPATLQQLNPVADPTQLRELALAAARLVAPTLRQKAGRTPAEDTKSTLTDMVTAADRWSEETLVNYLLSQRPNDGVLGEEGASVNGTSGVRWIIDPIDGTTNFMYGLTGYTVSIAAEVDGVLVAGVIVDPAAGDEFAAALGQGATRNEQEIRVRPAPNLTHALLATGFGYRPERRVEQAQSLVAVLPQVRDIRRFGGAAYELASVACGRVDGYFESELNLWDMAAGLVLVAEAGGVVTDLEGNFPQKDFVLATTAELHPELIKLLRSAEYL